MRRALAVLAITTFTGCSVTPFTVAWEYSDDEPEFESLKRCMAEELALAKADGVAEKVDVIPRRRAEAMRKLLEIVDAGDTPTEREYRRAGC